MAVWNEDESGTGAKTETETRTGAGTGTGAGSGEGLARVEVVILGRSRTFMCHHGEEDRLRAHAFELERRLQELGGEAAQDEGALLIAAALQMADELFEVHTEAEAAVAARESRLVALEESRVRSDRELGARLNRLAERLEADAEG
ncbi:MAG: cell division protein ZapA [Alphaproteobacteria bacterium]